MRITFFTAAVLGLIYMSLTYWVVSGRVKGKVMLGDGSETSGSKSLFIAIRAHANFAEYVPLALILLAGLEIEHAPHLLCEALAVVLILGRAMHPFGMVRKAPNPFRAGGAMLTWGMIGISSISLLAILAF
jgi:uncharacterized membrane protein YecN with MAPEG domain